MGGSISKQCWSTANRAQSENQNTKQQDTGAAALSSLKASDFSEQRHTDRIETKAVKTDRGRCDVIQVSESYSLIADVNRYAVTERQHLNTPI